MNDKRISTYNKRECAGCGACAVVCKKHCIIIGKDELGFAIPIVDDANCVNCGRCLSICPQQNKKDFVATESLCFVCQSNNSETLSQSSSGAFFSVLAEYVIAKNGIVWGVSVNDEGETYFQDVETVSDLWKIRGSKYIEVKEAFNYDELKKQLKAGRMVMVSGLPCQIRALQNILGSHDYPNLLLVDLLCYGIQSPLMWKLYLKRINPKGKAIKKVFMREKKYSWYDYSMKIEYKDGSKYEKIRWYDDWLLSYSRSVFNRESCACCESKKFPRASDFTIGDFWDADFYKGNLSGIDKKKGISIVYANTNKAMEIASKVKKETINHVLDKDYAKHLQKGFSVSVPFHPEREGFVKKAIVTSFHDARKQYLEGGFLFRLKKRKSVYKATIKNIIKRTLNLR